MEDSLIRITKEPISPDAVVEQAKTDSSGCVLAYVGLIRQQSHGKLVRSVEYADSEGKAESRLREIADEVRQKWAVNSVAIQHRAGTLKVGDINLVVAIAAAHRPEAFAACQYAIDQFKEKLPTHKTETYEDGTVSVEG